LEHARGELVASLDYDDLWYPGHLSSTVDALAAHADAVAAFTACDVITGADKKSRRVIRVVGPTTRRTIYSGGNRPYINTLVARREAVAGVGGFDPAFDGADDLDLVHKLAERGRFVYVDEVTVTYRPHDHNWSRDTRGLAAAGDRVLAAHLNRLRTAGDAEGAAGLGDITPRGRCGMPSMRRSPGISAYARPCSGGPYGFRRAELPLCSCRVRSAGSALEGLVDVLNDVVNVLEAYGQPDHFGRDAHPFQGRLVELAVRRRRRVGNQGFGIAHVHQALEQFYAVEEPDAGLVTTGRSEGHDRREAPPQVLLGQ
jgi:hypothetical protein